MTQKLFDRYYYSDASFEGGTRPFFRRCRQEIAVGADILEIGAGPTNACSKALSGIGRVTGVDIDPDVRNNQSLSEAVVFDGKRMPFAENSFDACVSNFVLEHVCDPKEHFKEVARVLRPGGIYLLRTPNLFHYVSFGSRMLPHSMHLKLANRLRGLADDAHDPYRTYYRANTRGSLRWLCLTTGMERPMITMIEPEPSYGRVHATLFYPMMAYERAVNSARMFSGFRHTIVMTARKLRKNA